MNASRLQKIDGTSAMDQTQAEIEGRKQAWWIHSFLQKYVGGFEDSFIVDTAAQVGVRETRRIVGDYTLDEKDVLAGRSFPDGIAVGPLPLTSILQKGKNKYLPVPARQSMRFPIAAVCRKVWITYWWQAGAYP